MVLIPAQILHEMRGFCCWKWSSYHEDIEHSLWQLQMYGNSHLCSGGGISQFLQWLSTFSERWPKVSPRGNYTSAHAKISFHTGTHKEKTAGIVLSVSQMKHKYQATYGNRMLHSFLFKETKYILNYCCSEGEGTQGAVHQPFTKSDKCVLLQVPLYMSLTASDDIASTVLWLKIWLYI